MSSEKPSNGNGDAKAEKAGPTPEGAQANRALDFNAHTATSQKVLEALSADPDGGLTDAVAKKRIEEYGPNRLKPPRRPSPFSIFLRQVGNAMTLVLSGSFLAKTRKGVADIFSRRHGCLFRYYGLDLGRCHRCPCYLERLRRWIHRMAGREGESFHSI